MSGDGIGEGAEPGVAFPQPPVGESIDGGGLQTLTPDPSGNGGIVERGDDVAPAALDTLATYLSGLTSDSSYGNRFTVAPDREPAAIQGADGRPAPLSLDNAGATEIFASQQDASNGLVQYSNSGIEPPDGPRLGDILRKGKLPGAPGALSGHDLLRSVEESATGLERAGRLPDGESPVNPIGQRTVGILGLNRFTPASTFTEQAETRVEEGIGTLNDIIEGRTLSSIQREFGAYDPRSRTVTTEEMSKVGKSISLRATGEFIARGEGADPTNPGVQVASLLPGEAQLAVTRPPTADFEAREVFREIFGEEFGGSLESDFNTSQGSFGNLTNCIEFFDSALPTGMIALAISLTLAAQISLSALLAVLSLLTGGKSGRSDQVRVDAVGRPFIGRSSLPAGQGNEAALLNITPGFIPLSQLGLQPVNYGFNRSVNAGIGVFFGSTGNLGEQLLDAVNPFGGGSFTRINQSPGFYAVFVRQIARGLGQIGTAAQQVVARLNPVAITEGVGNLFEQIQRSPVVSALNVFAQIGERALTLRDQGFDVSETQGGYNKFSKIDRLQDNAASHVMKSRQSDTLKLAWRTGATTSRMLLPTAVSKGILAIGAKDRQYGNPFGYLLGSVSDDGVQKVQHVANRSRLSGEEAQSIEALLDAEYVPFYFHDLRTNEIISFHAFLEGLTEDYTANYEVVSAYGRVDDVQHYRNTNRTISLTFTGVATNHEDHDELYAKLNKLVTMVYPQYTAGNLVNDLERPASFVQPFSQVIGGTPVIRMRIGDLIRSNYSRFNLARVFGLGTGAFQIDGQSIDDQLPNIVSDAAGAAAVVQQLRTEPQVGDIIKLRPTGGPGAASVSGYPPVTDESGLLAGLASSIGIDSESPVPHLTVTHPVLAQIRKANVNNGRPGGPIIVEVIGEDASSLPDPSRPQYRIAASDIIIDDEVIYLNLSGRNLITDNANLEDFQSFFEPSSNVIVRSFETAMGKGLAGVITTLNFDWSQATWETERFGSRAPHMFKCTLSFSAIHDLPPGIGSDGFNQAPHYNVGTHMRSVSGDSNDVTGAGRNVFNVRHQSINKTNTGET